MKILLAKLAPVLKDKPVLVTLGAGFLTSAAWVAFGLAAGLAAVGVTLLLLDLVSE